MITKRLILALLIVITAITVGCKKYPDGPLISFRTAKHRLLGTYNLTKYTVNGVDSLSMFNDSIPLTLRLWYDPVDDVYRGFATWYIGKGNYTVINSYWKLIDKNKEISFSYVYGYNGNVLYNITWTILRLTNKETEWTVTNNGKEYFMALEKQ